MNEKLIPDGYNGFMPERIIGKMEDGATVSVELLISPAYVVEIRREDPDWPQSVRVMQWRTEPPTEPGWYWVENDGTAEVVRFDGNNYQATGSYRHWEPGGIRYWLGPLPAPEMPR